MRAFDNDYGDDEAWDRAHAKAVMSEAKSLVVWLPEPKLGRAVCNDILNRFGSFNFSLYEYAHDLSGRFLGVFREVRA